MMKKHDFYAHRRHSVIVTLLIIFLVIIIKLFSIQFLNEEYKLSAENNVIRKIIKYPERGWIYDRNDKLLVSNQRSYDIMVVPDQVNKNIDTLYFCEVFNISEDYFRNIMLKSKKHSYYKPSPFIKDISKKEFALLQEKLHLFQGFYSQPKYVRTYSTPSAANIFGYISQISMKQLKLYSGYGREDLIGVSGIEKSYESILKGTKGVEYKIVDVYGKYQGKFNNGKNDTLPQKGRDIKLSIDIELQEYAEMLLKNKQGSVVAIEPKSGEILCLVTSPGYDPSLLIGKERNKNYRKLFLDPSKPFYDRSTSALYPPGSIFKLINALIALEEDKITPATLFKCNNGWNFRSILKIGCHHHKSPLNLRQAIAQSCNAYFCSTFQKILATKESSSKGLDNWYNHVKTFGLGQIYDSDIHNKKLGLIPNSGYYDKLYGNKRWAASTCISLGIGQDALLMTPLQMANLAVVMANRGYYRTPHLLKQKYMKNDTLEKYSKNFCSIDSLHFSSVIYGMQTAVEGKFGTAKSAFLNDITICGKTGTAENPHGDDHSIFIGFAPKKNPQIAIVTYVENGGWGSDLAAPIASLCIEKYLKDVVERDNLEISIKDQKILY